MSVRNVYCKGMNVASKTPQESNDGGSMVVDRALDDTWVGSSQSGDNSRLKSESSEGIRDVAS